MAVGIIDYGMGNLASVQAALEQISTPSEIIEDPDDINNFSHLILPGVGSFAAAMHNLQERNWPEALSNVAKDGSTSILGICLGMQLLASFGTEHGQTSGLGLVKGKIVHFKELLKDPFSNNILIPHVGWNEIHIEKQGAQLLDGVSPETDFYFVHSFVFVPDDKSSIIAKTPYGQPFVSIVQNERIWGVQFHPEKSSSAGRTLLQNFVNL